MKLILFTNKIFNIGEYNHQKIYNIGECNHQKIYKIGEYYKIYISLLKL